MKKKIYITVICVIMLIVLFVVITQKNNTHENENPPQPQKKGDQPPAPEIRQDPVLIKSLLNGVRLEVGNTSDGFTTLADVIVEEGQRIAEVHFFKRDANGRLSPQYLELVTIIGDLTGNFSIGNKVGGALGIRLAISGKEPGYLCLRLGGKYKIDGFMLPGESVAKKTSPLEPTFTIPEDLPPDSVYKVELVVLDEQFNNKD